MALLDYGRLRVAHGRCEGLVGVSVVFYSKSDSGVCMHVDGKSAEHQAFLERMGAKGMVGETHVLLQDACIVVFAGVGEAGDDVLTAKSNAQNAGAAAFSAVAHLSGIEISLGSDFMAGEAVSGMVLASYKYSFLMKKQEAPKRILISSECDAVKKALRVANAQNFSRFLADTPANLMNPTLFAEYAAEYLQGKNVEVEALDRTFMEERGMNLLLSVSQGSAQEPKLLVARYRGRSGSDVDLALVGKGVCFDSGGISLKPSAGMARMKGDMHGAACVLSAFGVAVDTGTAMNINLVIPLVENMPSGTATKPGDVFVGMNGKSVEVDNTDAEGRLILADALVFAQEASPKYILDVATLTGAMSVALGDAYIGFFTKDDSLADIILESGVQSNDPTWRMPLSAFYLPAMKSEVADLKNAGGRGGGSATAAIFLNEFVDKKFRWAHLDIAGVMGEHSNKRVFGNGMTGCSVPALVEIIERIAAAN